MTSLRVKSTTRDDYQYLRFAYIDTRYQTQKLRLELRNIETYGPRYYVSATFDGEEPVGILASALEWHDSVNEETMREILHKAGGDIR